MTHTREVAMMRILEGKPETPGSDDVWGWEHAKDMIYADVLCWKIKHVV